MSASVSGPMSKFYLVANIHFIAVSISCWSGICLSEIGIVAAVFWTLLTAQCEQGSYPSLEPRGEKMRHSRKKTSFLFYFEVSPESGTSGTGHHFSPISWCYMAPPLSVMMMGQTECQHVHILPGYEAWWKFLLPLEISHFERWNRFLSLRSHFKTIIYIESIWTFIS